MGRSYRWANGAMLWNGGGPVKDGRRDERRGSSGGCSEAGRCATLASTMNGIVGIDRPPRSRRVASPSRTGLSQWLRGPGGAALLRMEVERIHAAVGNLFGYHCLQIGDLAGADLMSESRILDRAVIDVDGGSPREPYPVVDGAATALPIDSHAVDVVILPHVIEFEERPHEALREASRVLVPEGHLVVLGFNPVSVIGLRQVFRHRTATAPWCGKYIGAGRLRDWITLLGFDVIDQRPCFASGRRDRAGPSGMRPPAEWMPPALASARLILAKKRVNAVLPIRPRWAPRRRLAGVGLAGPSARVTDDE